MKSLIKLRKLLIFTKRSTKRKDQDLLNIRKLKMMTVSLKRKLNKKMNNQIKKKYRKKIIKQNCDYVIKLS